ncbi:MAG: phosphatase PAP2 family protein [Verrucomicrobiota bacterium]
MIETSKTRRRWWPWLLAGAGLVALSFLFDNRVDAALDVTQDRFLFRLARGCSEAGEGWVVGVTGLFFAAVFMLADRPQVAARIFFVALASAITGAAATLVRVLVGRTRPTAHVPQGFYGVWHDGHWIIGKYDFSAFPSGHTGTAVGLMAAAWLVHRGWGGVAAVYALAVMWSRIALQAHHLSDVVGSLVLAILLAVWMRPFLLTSVEFHFGNLHRAWKKK